MNIGLLTTSLYNHYLSLTTVAEKDVYLNKLSKLNFNKSYVYILQATKTMRGRDSSFISQLFKDLRLIMNDSTFRFNSVYKYRGYTKKHQFKAWSGLQQYAPPLPTSKGLEAKTQYLPYHIAPIADSAFNGVTKDDTLKYVELFHFDDFKITAYEPYSTNMGDGYLAYAFKVSPYIELKNYLLYKESERALDQNMLSDFSELKKYQKSIVGQLSKEEAKTNKLQTELDNLIIRGQVIKSEYLALMKSKADASVNLNDSLIKQETFLKKERAVKEEEKMARSSRIKKQNEEKIFLQNQKSKDLKELEKLNKLKLKLDNQLIDTEKNRASRKMLLVKKLGLLGIIATGIYYAN